MHRPRIYVESTIPSAYYTSRTAPDTVKRREITRRWWAEAIATSELVTSAAVIREVVNGTSRHVQDRFAMIGSVTLLAVETAALEAAELYVKKKIMPADPHGDALHLALASHHECDALVTWDYLHLANPNKFNQIQRINMELGLSVPSIVTPKQLLEGSK